MKPTIRLFKTHMSIMSNYLLDAETIKKRKLNLYDVNVHMSNSACMILNQVSNHLDYTATRHNPDKKNYSLLHCKKKRRIINPHYAFMTVKSVYEPGVPFHKPFFLEKVGKGL